MARPWTIRVRDTRNDELLFDEECCGPLELGRKATASENLLSFSEVLDQSSRRKLKRLPIAEHTEDRIGRHHALVEALDERHVKVVNQSTKAYLGLEQGRELGPGGEIELTLPTSLLFGTRSVQIVGQPFEESSGENEQLEVLAIPTAIPSIGRHGGTITPGAVDLAELSGLEGTRIIKALQALLDVVQSAACDSEFYQKAAQAVVDMVGLDSGRVLLLHNNIWKPEAIYTRQEVGGRCNANGPPSQRVLKRVYEGGCTTRTSPQRSPDDSTSLAGVELVMASPIKDSCGKVIGALYGDRRVGNPFSGTRVITDLEARLMDLLAGCVAAGLARVEHESKACAQQARFEQFFGADMARYFEKHPEALRASNREITTLFCDIRSFSRFARKLGPELTLKWIHDVLNALSTCVLERQGVLVDYIGDELMAMWGAPREQADHAQRAAAAAIDMLSKLPELNKTWEPILGQPMGVGIGINTGVAQVGNTGSALKFKYGPLGDPVNVASRVQGVNKFFQTSVLLTRATRDLLGGQFLTRRVGAVRVHNIDDAIELFELVGPDQPNWERLRDGYEAALVEFERANFREAVHLLGNLVPEYPSDGPALMLMSRVAACLVELPDPFDPSFRVLAK